MIVNFLYVKAKCYTNEILLNKWLKVVLFLFIFYAHYSNVMEIFPDFSPNLIEEKAIFLINLSGLYLNTTISPDTTI